MTTQTPAKTVYSPGPVHEERERERKTGQERKIELERERERKRLNKNGQRAATSGRNGSIRFIQ
jgi:hypothetical protein